MTVDGAGISPAAGPDLPLGPTLAAPGRTALRTGRAVVSALAAEPVPALLEPFGLIGVEPVLDVAPVRGGEGEPGRGPGAGGRGGSPASRRRSRRWRGRAAPPARRRRSRRRR